jgi:hypothetical protein
MCNLKLSSQLIRILIGLALISLTWLGPQSRLLDREMIDLWSLGWLGIVPLLSGIAAFCPIYAVFGYGHKSDKQAK